ncbi:hypothetical protein TSAR_010455 [Trichomalopsis sarcophagae]|uniref:Uncharacterized protein n=1 Tax=Trichomalopsis sarcophagae TaxID=543379 RepID=A0A232EHM1_9HYME|nr:hypothetical protein TSAR_010455 [Trichomalopsis sarcophagae]
MKNKLKKLEKAEAKENEASSLTMKTLQCDNVHATINYDTEQSICSIEPPCTIPSAKRTLDNLVALGHQSSSDLPYELSEPFRQTALDGTRNENYDFGKQSICSIEPPCTIPNAKRKLDNLVALGPQILIYLMNYQSLFDKQHWMEHVMKIMILEPFRQTALDGTRNENYDFGSTLLEDYSVDDSFYQSLTDMLHMYT